MPTLPIPFSRLLRLAAMAALSLAGGTATAELKQGEKATPAAKPEVKIATKIALATGAN